MTRFEFTKKLRKALSGRVSHTVVNENVDYYEKYIDTEIKKGRSEREVLEELGDPRLIAKTIIDTTEGAGETVVEDRGRESSGRFFSGRIGRLPVWVAAVVVLLVIVFVFHIVGMVLSLILPVAVPILLIYYVIRYFRRR